MLSKRLADISPAKIRGIGRNTARGGTRAFTPGASGAVAGVGDLLVVRFSVCRRSCADTAIPVDKPPGT